MERKFTVNNLIEVLKKLPVDPQKFEVRIDNYNDYRISAICVSNNLETQSITLTDDLMEFCLAHDFEDSDTALYYYRYYDCNGDPIDISPYVGED